MKHHFQVGHVSSEDFEHWGDPTSIQRTLLECINIDIKKYSSNNLVEFKHAVQMKNQ